MTARSLERVAAEDNVEPRIRRVIGTIEERLHDRLAIEDLAGSVGLSSSRLRRLFREETGLSPAAYLQRKRMERARILLERTSLTVAQVMAQVGIADPSHFARDFRRAHGFSPRAFRSQLHGGTAPMDYLRPWRRNT